MKQFKRLFYMVLLNITISAATVFLVLQLWERTHPPVDVPTTPVVILVTPTQPASQPNGANSNSPQYPPATDTGVRITGTPQSAPSYELLSYRVKKGDTLGALAVEFNVSVADIMTVNGLTDPDAISEGEIIYIPTAPLPTATSTAIPPTMVPSVTPRPSATATPVFTPAGSATQPGQEAQLVINTVIGAGALENERVVLQRTGFGQLSLAGWQLEDGTGKKYLFPDLTLYQDGTINVNTRGGQNTVSDLYWGLNSPIWSSGKIVSLLDGQGKLRASYTVP